MVGKTLKELNFTKEVVPPYVSVKESVFPFTRFAGVDIILGPEMKSTGEVMGIDSTFPAAYARSQLGAGNKLPFERSRLYQSRWPTQRAHHQQCPSAD